MFGNNFIYSKNVQNTSVSEYYFEKKDKIITNNDTKIENGKTISSQSYKVWLSYSYY